VEAIVQALQRLYEDWKGDRLPVGNASIVARYDRRRLAGQLAALLEETLQQTCKSA